ncbi:hypothetical protein AB0J63_20250 [Streptosporangium canum]|uniref:hypothetical protein n=1 Tax=Streptosporangium canum TaxID=324952 RepID=UPI003417AF3C
MDLTQAQAPWDPDPRRLDTAGYGLPPAPRLRGPATRPDRPARRPHRPETPERRHRPRPHRPHTGSAIVTVKASDARRRPETAAIRAAVHAGKVRASFHPYTTVDHAAEALTR